MNSVGKTALITALVLSPLYTQAVWADEAALNQRIDRLERIIKGQGLVSLLSRVDQLQNEIQRLNGENESLHHELEAMQKRQRDLYLDLDERLQSQPKAGAVVVTPTTTSANVESAVSSSMPVTTPVEAPATTGNSVQSGNEVAPSVASQVNTAPVAVENGEAAYQAALQTLRSGQYEQAITALTAFPDQYPQSNYIPNAYYWKGEANYVLQHFDLAINDFQTVIDRFPKSTKIADATLKRGFSEYELGKIDAALTTLNYVVEQYPNTSAARLAKVRIDRINKATR